MWHLVGCPLLSLLHPLTHSRIPRKLLSVLHPQTVSSHCPSTSKGSVLWTTYPGWEFEDGVAGTSLPQEQFHGMEKAAPSGRKLLPRSLATAPTPVPLASLATRAPNRQDTSDTSPICSQLPLWTPRTTDVGPRHSASWTTDWLSASTPISILPSQQYVSQTPRISVF